MAAILSIVELERGNTAKGWKQAMKQTRTAKRREAAINSVKILLTSVSLAATVGGWAVISTSSGAAVNVAQANPTTAVQDFLASRSTTTVDSSAATAATAATADTTGGSTTQNNSLTAATVATAAAAPIATTAPTATAVPTQIIVQRTIRTRSSR